jgi:hypothetical protein
VEVAPKDDYWGAKPIHGTTVLVGRNVLGRLLWILRGRLEVNLIDLRSSVIDIPNFRLAGEDAIELALNEELV